MDVARMKKIDCARHHGVPALQQCQTCQRPWCDNCIPRVKVGGQTTTACPMCRQPLQPIDRDTVARTREAASVGDLITRPFSGEPLLTTVILAVIAWLEFLPGLGRYLYWIGFGAVVAYYFEVIDHIGRGRPGMPETAEAFEDFSSLRRLAQRGLLCFLVAALPYLVWNIAFGPHLNPSDGLVWLAVGLLYMPAALLTVVITGSTAGALWPVAWVQIAGRAPVEYLVLVALFLASLGAAWFAHTVLPEALSVIPVVGRLLALTIERLLWFMQAALVGGFLSRNAEKFGWD
jgi:hypothetical protein